MAAVVRDEADLLRDWVRYHAEQGVDVFLVVDHRSVDGTTELLGELAGRYDLHWRRRVDAARRQDLWMTELAVEARERHGADWVVLADGDEFWVPERGSLRDAVRAGRGCVHIAPRSNMLPDRGALARSGYRFFHNIWRVARPFPDHPPAPALGEPLEWPLFLRRLPGKVVCSTVGLERVLPGNHEVVHDWEAREAAAIEILHYPIRRYRAFERQTAGHGGSLELERGAPREQGWHQRRLHAVWRSGRLRRAYDELLDDVERYGGSSPSRLVRDHRLWRALSPETLPVEAPPADGGTGQISLRSISSAG